MEEAYIPRIYLEGNLPWLTFGVDAIEVSSTAIFTLSACGRHTLTMRGLYTSCELATDMTAYMVRESLGELWPFFRPRNCSLGSGLK